MGCLNALLLWLPILIYKFFVGLWKLNLFIIQMICGVPLYYCSPGFKVLGIFLGTAGLLIIVEVFLLLILGLSSAGNKIFENFPIKNLILMGLLGIGLLLLCRLLIRRGSI